MHPDIISLSRNKRFKIGNYEIISQEPDALRSPDRNVIISLWFPIFMFTWREIERVTGHRWKCTSYIRNSPSHSLGQSMDLAPDIDPSAERQYGVYVNSDPVLYKRAPLIRSLQSLNSDRRVDPFLKTGLPSNLGIGLFIESDHIHMQVIKKDSSAQTFAIVKWGIAKPLYPDTYDRKELPFTSSKYRSI